ncbi:MAG: DNA repair protein [Hyphomicrobiales bacterium]
MDPAAALPTLNQLRQTLAGIDPSHAPRLAGVERLVTIDAPIDAILGGGLSCGAFHEFAPKAPMHLAATSGFATALAARASGDRRQMLWITTDYAAGEGGGPYGPGIDLFGMTSARLLMLRVAKPVDVLWAMEEALRCRALACVIAELTADGAAADLTATRRLALAAREGVSAQNSGFGLLIRHKATAMPSAAATRWEIAAAPSRPDAYGGLGRARFDLSLCKNRRGPSGRWIIEWDHHERAFQQAVPVVMAAPAFDRPDRTARVRAG